MRMLCYKCSHPWKYKGIISEGKLYVTCPNCMRKVRVDRSLVEDSSEQRLLTSVSKKEIRTTSFPLELPITTSFKIEFESIKDKQGLTYSVDKRISKQFRDVLNEEREEETPAPGIEPGSNLSDFNMKILRKSFESENHYPAFSFKILAPSLPTSIQKAIYEKEQEQNNPFLNPPKEEPNFQIRIIPRDPIKHLNHMKNF